MALHKVTLLVLLSLVSVNLSSFAKPITLKPMAIVNGTEVKTSDIFMNVDPDKDIVLLRAPEPGKQITLTSSQLRYLAHASKIEWNHRLSPASYTIKRASHVISVEHLKEELTLALQNYTQSDSLLVQIIGKLKEIHIPINEYAALEVESVEYIAKNGKFSALINITNDRVVLQSVKVRGYAFPALELPVLQRMVQINRPLEEKDITWIKFKLNRIPADAVVDASKLIGVTLKRSITPGNIILQRYLQSPWVIYKGDIINVIHQKGNLTLTVPAKAMENATKNQEIQFQNLKTRTLFYATVINSDLAKTLN